MRHILVPAGQELWMPLIMDHLDSAVTRGNLMVFNVYRFHDWEM